MGTLFQVVLRLVCRGMGWGSPVCLGVVVALVGCDLPPRGQQEPSVLKKVNADADEDVTLHSVIRNGGRDRM